MKGDALRRWSDLRWDEGRCSLHSHHGTVICAYKHMDIKINDDIRQNAARRDEMPWGHEVTQDHIRWDQMPQDVLKGDEVSWDDMR